MKRQTRIILFAVTVLFLGCSGKKTTSQETSLMMAEVYRICPKADVINVENKFESKEIEFLCDDQPISLVFDSQGNVLYKESPYKPDAMFLNKLNKKIQKNHAGWILDEISLIETADTSFVKVEVLKHGIEENLFFTLDGKFYKIKNYIATETWSQKTLEKSAYYASLPYDMLHPKKQFDVPEVLKEISGLSVVGDSVIFCVQDELGAVFQVDLRDESLSTVGRFTDVGDFEDVQVVGNMVYVLRSDGSLFSFNYEKFSGHCSQVMLNVPCMNLEGLFYDAKAHQFLVSCKEPSLGLRTTDKKQHKREVMANAEKERMVYSIDVQHNNAVKPILSIKIDDIRSFVKKHYENVSTETMAFNPSALAIHPITNELYVLSASERMIVVYDGTVVKQVILLSPDDFYKPEGLDFLSNGDMVICNEGMKKGYLQGTVAVFEMKK
ncbi:MAG: hypothetical protein II926_09885 [Bacteroidales bacterium]|nr:hypothetical protein [Bacteroidales bacterium]